MSCLTKRKIYTNAHRLYKNLNTNYMIEAPCGECTECLKAKSNEWRARTYYEFMDCMKKGGFVLWDRLSYDNENLPHLAKLEHNVPKSLDFTCFNKEDVQLFMKRLRENLAQRRIGARKKIRYLIAAEYGQEEGTYITDKGQTREATLRPHYHMILYCTAKIKPAELSMEIRKAWKKGTTNGIEDNPGYFNEKGVIKTKADAITISDYIGKYCLKSQSYDKVADYKIREIVRHYTAQEKGKDYDNINDKELASKLNRERIQAMKSKVKTFHVQSQGYGAYAMEDKRALKKEGLLGMPDKQKTWFYQKLPMYFERKIYHNYIRTKEGKVIWYLNEKGIEWKTKNAQKTIEGAAKKYTDMIEQLRNPNFVDIIRGYNESNQINLDAKEQWRRLNDLQFAYLNGRKWTHYAEYTIFHKGRIWGGKKSNPEETIRNNARASLNAEKEKNLYYNYNHTTDKDNLGKKIIGVTDLGDKWRGYRRPVGNELEPEQFAKIYTINEESLEEWNNYDKLGNIIDTIKAYIEDSKAKKEKRKERTELSWKAQKKTLYINIT